MNLINHRPEVSVILPTFNRARELPRSIYSVLSQTFSDFELIVVDDASSDDTSEVVASINDSRIRYERLVANVGGAEARNVGIRKARGEFIAFQDSDDEWRCYKLEKCVSILRNDRSLIGVFSAFWQIRDRAVRYMPVVNPPSSPENFQEALIRANFIGTPTAVVRAESLMKIGGFDPEMPRYQDWDLFLRLSGIGYLGFIEEPLVLSYCTVGSISTNQAAHKDALIKIFQKNREMIEKNSALKADWLHRIGDAQLQLGEVKSGRKKILQAVILRPLNLRYIVKALFAFPGNSVLYKILTYPFRSRW